MSQQDHLIQAGSDLQQLQVPSIELGPGEGYPYPWDKFNYIDLGQLPSAVRHFWRTGGVLIQIWIQALNYFGERWAGWQHDAHGLAAGHHTFSVSFYNGPITSVQGATRIFAQVLKGTQSVAYQNLVARRGPQSLNLSADLSGGDYRLRVGAMCGIYGNTVPDYAEVIVQDIKVRHFPPGQGIAASEARGEARPAGILQESAAVEVRPLSEEDRRTGGWQEWTEDPSGATTQPAPE